MLEWGKNFVDERTQKLETHCGEGVKRVTSPLLQNLIHVMHEHEVIEFVAVLIVVEHVKAFVAVEAGVFWISFTARRHPRGGERVARTASHSMRAKDVVDDGIAGAVEAIVRREQPHVGEDEHVLAITLMQIDVWLAESDVQIDEPSLCHVGFLEIAQFLSLGPIDNGLAVVDRSGSSAEVSWKGNHFSLSFTFKTACEGFWKPCNLIS